MSTPATATARALGTTVHVAVADLDGDAGRLVDRALAAAIRAVSDVTDDFDAACSRFRDDSELMQLNAVGRPVAVSGLLFEALQVAIRAAELTGGLVDPTVGGPLRDLGYDRDFQFVSQHDPSAVVSVRPAPGWETIRLDERTTSVWVPHGVHLDLGATAKALCVDHAARAAAGAAGRGVLVNIGGDLAVAGRPPEDGWTVQLSDDHADAIDRCRPAVTISTGGLATSGTTVRRWSRGGMSMHHLIDPATGQPADEVWQTCTVAAGSCVDANIASTAAIIVGAAAPAWLEDHGLPARLVSQRGAVVTVGDWPADECWAAANPCP